MSDDLVKTLLESLTPEQKQQLVAGLLSSIGQSSDSKPQSDVKVVTKPQSRQQNKKPSVLVNKDFTVVRVDGGLDSKKSPVRAKGSSWVDDGLDSRDEECVLTAEQMEQMAKTKVARNRPEPVKTEVVCHVCNKTFYVNPESIYGEFHRCDRCIRK